MADWWRKTGYFFMLKPLKKRNEVLCKNKSRIIEIKTEVLGVESFSIMGSAQKAYFLQKLGLLTKLGPAAEEVLACANELSSINNKRDSLIKNQRIKDMALVSAYRARRLQANMPVRGQRTHTNAKTRRKRAVF